VGFARVDRSQVRSSGQFSGKRGRLNRIAERATKNKVAWTKSDGDGSDYDGAAEFVSAGSVGGPLWTAALRLIAS
jgi:hypothetical protein